MSTADKALRWSTVAAVVVVAAVAASFSYHHALDVIGQHSRQSPFNNAFPLTVDGLIQPAGHPLPVREIGVLSAASFTVSLSRRAISFYCR